MRRGLDPDDLRDLLGSKLCCTLATYRRSGEALLSPVWFVWRDGGFELSLGRGDVKVQHLRRDPRASVAVYESDPPYRGLELRGQAELLEDGITELRRELFIRYLGVDPPGEDSSQIRVRVTGTFRGWDYADESVFAEYAR
jgi:PPOX class probable F420-dependent enzyme